ncbi:MAG: DUF2817 domain-containing protein [Candidatus Delongbacteria bacterium]|nr:DUF2817 domain-containing protein [Candidatus Delongbacteria bacterium]
MKKTMIYLMIFAIMVFGAKKFEYAKVKVSGIEDLKFLKKHEIDIDRTSFQGKEKGFPEYLKIYVDQERFDIIENEGYTITWEPLKLPKDASSYRYNEDIGDSMLVWQNRYPAICKRIQIGTSVQSRPLWVLKISDNVNIEEAEPEVKFVSTMHGDEVTGVEMEMYLIEDILKGYQANNDTMQFIVNNTELYVMPLLNPDGMANNSRYNANYIDLNRDFPDFLTGETNLAESDEPEIDAMINWSNDHNFILSTNYHGGALVANYILDTKPPLTSGQYAAAPDDVHATWLASNYAIRNTPMYNGAFTEGITNGLEWYEAVGGMQDWNYHYYGDMDLTLEISNTKWPAYSEIAGFWQDNRDAMFWYLSAVHKGIYGIVTDYDTGLPLEAKIEITGIDKEYYTDPDFGDYYRVLKPGTYTMTVSAPGYTSQIINNVVVTDDTGSFREATEVNVQLQMGAAPEVAVSVQDTLAISANPGFTGIKKFDIGNSGNADLTYNQSVSYIKTKGSGGPDTYGYSWKDSDEPDGPAYNWVDISSLGTPLGLSDDGISSSLALGFAFNFYGTDYSTVRIGANGAITFTGTAISYTNPIIPSSSAPNAVIAPFWDDLDPSSGQSDDIYYYYDSANGRFIVQYNQIINYGGGTKNTFEVLLYQNGTIILQYNTMNGTLDACTVGIESGDGSDGIQVVYNSAYIKNSLAIEFKATIIPEWLSLDPSSGTVSASGSEQITATANTDGLDYGIYYADINLNSNDPSNSTVIIPVKFIVSDALSSPVNVVPNTEAASCSLSWDAVTGATVYNIYRSTDPYSGFIKIDTSLTNLYIDNDILTGNKYFYYVTADDAK